MKWLTIGLFGTVFGCTQSEQSGEAAPHEQPGDLMSGEALPVVREAKPFECVVTEDRDGDGAVRTLDVCADASDVGPFNQSEDCDDGDPTRRYWVQYYVDADRDGYGKWTSDPVWACLAHELDESILWPEGYCVDCDDTDPARHTWAYVDGDGDGDGALGSDEVCVGADAVGYVAEAWDCNDQDATTHAAAAGEQPLDDTDTDCDGNDYPVLRWRSPDDPVPLLTLPAASRCDGAALSLLAVEDFSYRCGAFRLTIANRGSMETGPGRLRLRGYDSADVDLPSLEPGGFWSSEVFPWSGHTEFTLSFTAAPGDCAAKDDAGSFRITEPIGCE